MNKKLFVVMAGSAVFALASQASALTVTTNGTSSVQATVSSSVQMQGNSNMQGSSTMGSSSANGSLNVDLGGGSLQTQVSAGTVDSASDSGIVSLQGNSIGLIQSSADLTAYNNLVMKARPAVTSVNVNSDNSVDVGYAQPAKFLGIFSTSLSGDVHVDASGNTTVNLPWYAFLYSKDTTGVQTSVASAVQQSGAQFNAQADAMTSAQDHARVINAASAAIQAQASASATASGSY